MKCAILLPSWRAIVCPSRQSPERNCGESHQISTTSVGCYIQKPSPHRRAVENVFSRSYMLNKSASSLPKLKRNLGKPAYHAKWSFDRKSFSTSDARSRIESKSKTPHEKYRETSARVLELLDEIFCSQSAAKKQVVQKARKSIIRRGHYQDRGEMYQAFFRLSPSESSVFQVCTEKITVYKNKPVESAKKLVRDTLPSGFDIYIQFNISDREFLRLPSNFPDKLGWLSIARLSFFFS